MADFQPHLGGRRSSLSTDRVGGVFDAHYVKVYRCPLPRLEPQRGGRLGAVLHPSRLRGRLFPVRHGEIPLRRMELSGRIDFRLGDDPTRHRPGQNATRTALDPAREPIHGDNARTPDAAATRVPRPKTVCLRRSPPGFSSEHASGHHDPLLAAGDLPAGLTPRNASSRPRMRPLVNP